MDMGQLRWLWIVWIPSGIPSVDRETESKGSKKRAMERRKGRRLS